MSHSDFVLQPKPVDETKNYFTTTHREPKCWAMKLNVGKVLHLADDSGTMCGAFIDTRFFTDKLTREHKVMGRPVCKDCMRRVGWLL